MLKEEVQNSAVRLQILHNSLLHYDVKDKTLDVKQSWQKYSNISRNILFPHIVGAKMKYIKVCSIH